MTKGIYYEVTPEQRAAILDALRRGHYVETAAKAAGVAPTTFWRRTKEDPKLLAAVRAAIAESENSLIVQLNDAREWQSKAWLLERRFAKRWARKQPDTVIQQISKEFSLPDDPSERAAVLRALADAEDEKAKRGK